MGQETSEMARQPRAPKNATVAMHPSHLEGSSLVPTLSELNLQQKGKPEFWAPLLKLAGLQPNKASTTPKGSNESSVAKGMRCSEIQLQALTASTPETGSLSSICFFAPWKELKHICPIVKSIPFKTNRANKKILKQMEASFAPE